MESNKHNFVKYLLLTFLLQGFCLISSAQDGISVTYDQDNGGNYKFYSHNENYCTYTLEVNFQELRNLKWRIQIPFIKEINHGTNYLFTLEAGDPYQNSSFQYSIAYINGCMNPEINSEINYLLPVGKGKITKTFPIDYLKINERTTEPKDYYAVGFIMEEGDTIFAARRGVVCSLRDTSSLSYTGYVYSSDDNYIEIFQQDCSFARYQVLSKSLVIVGQHVEAGDPIAIAGGENYTTGIHVRFLVYYNDADQNQSRKGLDLNAKMACVPLVFCTEEQQNQQLTVGNMYTGAQPDSIITQEMSKRELKKWKR